MLRRNIATALPGNVPQPSFHGRVAQPMDGADAARTSAGPLKPGPEDDGLAEGQAHNRAVAKGYTRSPTGNRLS